MSRSVVITKTEEVKMLEAVKDKLNLLTTPEALSECIRYTYERVCGETVESTADIVQNYRDIIRDLRVKVKKITTEIINADNEETVKELVKKLSRINQVVNITRNIAKTDGDFNDILFDVVAKGKMITENKKAIIASDRNEIMRDKVNHEINMDVIHAGIGFEGGE